MPLSLLPPHPHTPAMRSQADAARKQGGLCWTLLPCWFQPAWPFPLSCLLSPPPTSFLSAILSSPFSQPSGPSLCPVLLASELLVGPVPWGFLGRLGEGPSVQPVALQDVGWGWGNVSATSVPSQEGAEGSVRWLPLPLGLDLQI